MIRQLVAAVGKVVVVVEAAAVGKAKRCYPMYSLLVDLQF
jgi:hypothetical protein